jgi:DNA-binding MarR family transcriptional regulator
MNPSVLDPARLNPSGSLLSAQLAVSAAIERDAVRPTSQDSTTIDLLLRLALSPGKRLRGVELGRQLRLNPGYVSRRIDRAEEAGLVQRADDPDDRRAQLIVLTDAGQSVVDDFVPHLNRVLKAVIFDTLSTAEITVLVSLLNRIEEAAQSHLERTTQD